MLHHYRNTTLTVTMLLASSIVFATSSAHAAASPGVACASGLAKAMSKCVKKTVLTQTTCYKKTGALCAADNDKLVKAEASAGDGIRAKCENDAAATDAGYAPFNKLNMSTHFGDLCLQHALIVAERTFGVDGSDYTDADDDGKKCLVAAAKASAKFLSGALGDISKCVETGCTFDFTERVTAATEAVNKKCPDLAAVTGENTAAYVAASNDQVLSVVAAPCDSTNNARCLYPFPNDYFTIPGADSPTGRRLAFGAKAIITPGNGPLVTPDRWNEADGFSVGAMILLNDVNIDLATTGAAPITDLAESIDSATPMMLIDAETGAKQLMWWERDLHGATIADQPIIGRVAKNLKENHRYIVALRNVKDISNVAVAADPDFAIYRDNTPSLILPVEARRDHMEDIFSILTTAGITRSELYLAWDFTTQSSESAAGRLLAMRDDAFDILGAAAPAFTVDNVIEPLDGSIFRQVDGTFQVPLYLNTAGIPGSTLREGPGHVPVNTGDFFTAEYSCLIPYAATTGGVAPAVPARVSMYGHGLLGDHSEVDAGNIRNMSSEHNMVFCATDWTGFSDDDFLFVATVVNNYSNFPKFIDRQHQGVLNFMFLGRLLTHASGFTSHTAFQVGGESMLDTSNLFYDGNSQGGILGGVLAAFETTATRFALGVPGINYSTLLNRSVDFELFDVLLTGAYPNSSDRNLLLSVGQVIWDRTDPSGHINHVTADPYAGTPAKKLLYQVAFGDHQVAPVTAEIAARSNGASIHTPTLSMGKVVPEVTPYYGIPAIPGYPFSGSALVIYDAGNPAPPIGNEYPPEIVPDLMDPEWLALGPCAQSHDSDPHSCVRSNMNARLQKSEFLKSTGAVVDVCSAAACLAP